MKDIINEKVKHRQWFRPFAPSILREEVSNWFEHNKWYYDFIKSFHIKTGVPILLNTSFNDREPIVETPLDAIKCFKNTEIDYLYFYDYNILVKKSN